MKNFKTYMRCNTRRVTNLSLAFVPLMMLLVGSCKTSQLPGAYGGIDAPEQFRTALFPDSVNFRGISYYPAEGYISRAQKYVQGSPDSLAMLTDREVTYLFGNPVLERHDADAKIWQFTASDCVVDFYFYDTDGKDTSDVSYVDVHTNNAKAEDRSACVSRVIDKGDFSSTRI